MHPQLSYWKSMITGCVKIDFQFATEPRVSLTFKEVIADAGSKKLYPKSKNPYKDTHPEQDNNYNWTRPL